MRGAGRPFLPARRFSDELVIAMGLGHLTYPFEARPGYFEDITPTLQPLLTSLLSRDPTKRPSIDEVSNTVCLDLTGLMLSLSSSMQQFSSKQAPRWDTIEVH